MLVNSKAVNQRAAKGLGGGKGVNMEFCLSRLSEDFKEVTFELSLEK